ncbi:ATP-binding protein [Patescibacteria group bacterium]|nr:ATP-binding protein [Patescibacteria group bacterium]
MDNLQALIYPQNPQWNSKDYFKPEKGWFLRPVYHQSLSWLDKRVAVALTGLRRTGKSTILQQIKYHLEENIAPEQVLFFSFEKAQVKYEPETLRNLLNWYFEDFLKSSPKEISKRVYILLDEVQYIPHWQDTLKWFYDLNPNFKFFLSGSSSLFIYKKATESLAGRIIDITVPPLSFKEYCNIKSVLDDANDLPKIFGRQPNLVNSHFKDYLEFGQFPELVKENYKPDQSKLYLQTIEEKIVEQDLPKIYKVNRPDILHLIFSFVKNHPGALLEYSNLANDLGIDVKTTAKYLGYLKKSFLLDLCLNNTKKLAKSSRTAKKVYLGSVNFSRSGLGETVENYVFNFLSGLGKVEFFRLKNFEVDFVLQQKNPSIFEVKYQEHIEQKDSQNLVKLAKSKKLDEAYLITKNNYGAFTQDGMKINLLPACLLETYFSG